MTNPNQPPTIDFPIPLRYRRFPANLKYYNLQNNIGERQGFWTAYADEHSPTISDEICVIPHDSGKESVEQLLRRLDAALIGVTPTYASFDVKQPNNRVKTFYAPSFDQAKNAGTHPLTRVTVFMVLRQAPATVWAIEYKNSNTDIAAQLWSKCRMLASQYTRWRAAAGRPLDVDVKPYSFWLEYGTLAPKNNVSAFALACKTDGSEEAMQYLDGRLVAPEQVERFNAMRAAIVPLCENWFSFMVGEWQPARQGSLPAPAAPAPRLQPAAPAAPDAKPEPEQEPTADQPAGQTIIEGKASQASQASLGDGPWPAVAPATGGSASPAAPAAAAAAPRPRMSPAERNTVSSIETSYLSNIKPITTPAQWNAAARGRWTALMESANAQAQLRGIVQASAVLETYSRVSEAIAALGKLVGQLVAYDMDTANADLRPEPAPAGEQQRADQIPF